MVDQDLALAALDAVGASQGLDLLGSREFSLSYSPAIPMETDTMDRMGESMGSYLCLLLEHFIRSGTSSHEVLSYP